MCLIGIGGSMLICSSASSILMLSSVRRYISGCCTPVLHRSMLLAHPYVIRKESLAKSILNKRVFPDAQGEKEWARSVMESEGEVLCVVSTYDNMLLYSADSWTVAIHLDGKVSQYFGPDTSERLEIDSTKKGSKPDFHGAMAADQVCLHDCASSQRAERIGTVTRAVQPIFAKAEEHV